MLAQLAQFSLILALCLGLVQSIFPLLGAHKNELVWMQWSRSTTYGQLFFVSASFFILATCFLTNDFSVLYVAQNSNSLLPAVYRFCAVWGGHEGSLLLWLWILVLWMSAVATFSRRLPMSVVAQVLSVLSLLAVGFYLFILLTSNPFLQNFHDIPMNGRDLNPLLQDPGMVIHPPMLYMGYVGFSVSFAFAIAALLSGKLDVQWVRWMRPWTLSAWCFLTYGIVAGSWWAYRQLGWGGWWFWDPVENASFMPWLAGTALIHSLMVSEKRNIFKAWTALLAIGTFCLSLLGTFLVRSGVLISVHAFAEDPRRGQWLLLFLFSVLFLSLLLYFWRSKQLTKNSEKFHLLSREVFLLSNNVILVTSMLTVLLGTLYPLVLDELGLEKISVGYPYFNAVFIPLMVPLLFLIGIGPSLHWYRSDLAPLKKLYCIIFLMSFVLAVIFPFLAGEKLSWGVLLGLCLALWVSMNTLYPLFQKRKLPFQQWGVTLAHLGLVVTVIGIVLSSAYSKTVNIDWHVGERAVLGPYEFTFSALTERKTSNYRALRAEVIVNHEGKQMTTLFPEFRNYPVATMSNSKADIEAGVFRDIYIALGNPLPDKGWSVRLFYKPFIRWIWGGGILMMLGGICAVIHLITSRKTDE